MTDRVKNDWQTWILGAMLGLVTLLMSWGYTSLTTQIQQNREEIRELARTGAYPLREVLADHGARIIALERGIEKNDADHARILLELQTIRETLLKQPRK